MGGTGLGGSLIKRFCRLLHMGCWWGVQVMLQGSRIHRAGKREVQVTPSTGRDS